MLLGQNPKNIKQKQYCNKFKKKALKMIYFKKSQKKYIL